MNRKGSGIICPLCEEGELFLKACTNCGREYLICDECEAVYKGPDELDFVISSYVCPHCTRSLE